MRRRVHIWILCLAAVLLSSGLGRADPIITVDELGNGTLDFTASGGGKFPLPFAVIPDPGPGGGPAVLTYNLLGPPDLAAGGVFLFDSMTLSDVVRFNPAGTGGPGYPASLV